VYEKLPSSKVDISETLLEWHRDRQDCVVEVVHGEGWIFQRDDSISIQII